MRSTISTALLLFVFTCLFGQDTSFTKNDALLYGTPKEKHEQEALWDKTGYELYRLIGYKEFYVNGLSSYLQLNGYNLDDTKYIKGGSEFIFSPRIGMGTAPKIYFKYWVNNNNRITKVRITGYPYGLAYLFVHYWPVDIQWASTESLKKGVVATKILIDEKIIYNYSGTMPFIEISK